MVAKPSPVQVLEVAPAVRASCHEALGRFPLARVYFDSTPVPFGICHHEGQVSVSMQVAVGRRREAMPPSSHDGRGLYTRASHSR